MTEKDYYAILGLPRGSSLAEIRLAYRRLAALYHPDKLAASSQEEQAESANRMVELNAAMSILGNVRRRSAYDRELRLVRPVPAFKGAVAPQPDPPSPKPETPAPARREETVQRPSLEKRVRSIRVRLESIPLQWRDLKLPQWAWGVEGGEKGGRILMAHQHSEVLDSSAVRALEKAVRQLLEGQKQMLNAAWLIVLLTCGDLHEARSVVSGLEMLAKKKQGWFQKAPLILLYEGTAGRILRFGEVQKHDLGDQIMQIILRP